MNLNIESTKKTNINNTQKECRKCDSKNNK